MENLLLSTAVIAFGALAPNPSTNDVETISQSEYSSLYEKVALSSIGAGFHAGDFQTIARAVKQNALYDGLGSSLMTTVRLLRY